MFFHPMGETRIGTGDVLIGTGKAEAVAKLISNK